MRGRPVSNQAIRDWDEMYGTHRAKVDEWVAGRLLAGMHPKAVAVASCGRLSERSAYRWKKALLGLEVVEIAGQQATFAIRRGYPPARISEWRAA